MIVFEGGDYTVTLNEPSDGKKIFECEECGCQFIKRSPSSVLMCIQCEHPCIERKYKRYYSGDRYEGRLTDQQALRKLPYYQQKKYFLIKNPKAWEEDIRQRVVESKDHANNSDQRVYLKDKAGNRLYNPDLVNL